MREQEISMMGGQEISMMGEQEILKIGEQEISMMGEQEISMMGEQLKYHDGRARSIDDRSAVTHGGKLV